ncbi:hypothetical protein [Halorhabdus rudnickae]|uniref:hypothetical protein n=1 Tax=Halorhabdus rudnickae TaxID=1775544 RepID=UPI0010845DFB|nr:hypothetical protein [Halorhabdus rudnickae]
MKINQDRASKLVVLAVCVAALGLVALGGAAGSAGAAGGPPAQLDGTGTAADPYVITNVSGLQGIDDDLDSHYILGADIDASDATRAEAIGEFEPIGGPEDPFQGSFDGQGHVVTGLSITRSNSDGIGVFSRLKGTIRNVHFADVSVHAQGQSGTVVGTNDGTVRRVSATGEMQIETRGNVGGSASTVGGLVGRQTADGELLESWADVDIQSPGQLIGGVAGRNDGLVANSYALGSIESATAGGLVGYNTGTTRAGYAAGAITTVENDGVRYAGGLAARNTATLTGVYWDQAATGQPAGVGDGPAAGTALRTADMTGAQAATEMPELDLEETWVLTDDYPILQWEVQAVHVDISRQIISAGNNTTATISASRVSPDMVGLTSTVTAQSENPDIATVTGDNTIVAESPGQATISASAAGETGSTDIIVIAAEGISAIDAHTNSPDVMAGETVTVTGTFRNVDKNTTYHHADLLVDGEAVATENVTVDGDSNETHTFEWTPESAGTYALSIDGIDTGSVEVSPQPSTESIADDSGKRNGDGDSNQAGDGDQTDNSGPATRDDSGLGGLPVPLVGGVIVVAIGGGVLLGRRL